MQATLPVRTAWIWRKLAQLGLLRIEQGPGWAIKTEQVPDEANLKWSREQVRTFENGPGTKLRQCKMEEKPDAGSSLR